MDDDSLRKIIAEIDALPHEGEPRSHISIGKPACYVFVTANKAGLVSLARAFLIAATSPQSAVDSLEITKIEDPHLQVLKSKDDVAIGWIEHADVVPTPQQWIDARKQQAWRNDRFALLGCSLVGFVVLLLMILGLNLLMGILTRSS